MIESKNSVLAGIVSVVAMSILPFSAPHTLKKGSDQVEIDADQVTYLALGDSYTIGESVDSAKRFPVQLTQKLRNQGLSVEDPKIIATTGWTTTDLSNAMDEQYVDDSIYDVVTLLIGVNDQYQHREINLYPDNFRTLLDRAITIAGGDPNRVFVLSIPDYAFTPFGQKKNPREISREIDAYNTINKGISVEKQVHYFDITPISRQGIEQKALVAADGLHPSGEMYGLWTDLMVDVMIQQLR